MNRKIAAVLLCVVTPAVAGDWPQFRHDAHRSAATTAGLPPRLNLQWAREFAKPRPAFPDELRLGYDGSYEPVVLGKTMFVPSMVTDSVTALATDTGKVQWRFFTDGPVRFAPVADDGRVYFTSDDGHLYCVSADTGKLVWKFRGLPADRKDRWVVGNGRVISLRPARGGPVLKDGIVYFGAGIWLGDGIFVHALDAKTGKPRWSNSDSNLLKKANLDHGVKSYSGLAPQGYLAVMGEKLIVPCGAQLPGFLDRKTGKLEPYTMGWGGRVGLPKGSWLVAGTDKYLVHSGDLYDISRRNDERFKKPRRNDFKGQLYPGGYTRLMIDPKNRRALGEFKQPVLTKDTLVLSDPRSGLEAFDLASVELKKRVGNPRRDRYPDKWAAALKRRWKLNTKLKVHIRAGNRLYLGGPGVIEAVELPKAGGKPALTWRIRIKGTPHRMLAADDKLFVVTREGHILAFGEKRVDKPVVHERSRASVAKKDRWTARAESLVKATKATEGYAIVIGAGSGRLIEELVRQSQLFVIAVDSDADRVSRLRRRFHRAGIYGTRVSVHVGDALNSQFPPYLAHLVTSEDPSRLGSAFDTRLARKLYYLLRPYGGAADFAFPGLKVKTAAKVLAAAKLDQSVIKASKSSVRLVRSGPLRGAADWSHKGANAANAGASQDRFLKAPLGILWFDGSVRWNRKPGSATIRVSGGRVFILSKELLAVDVFTGRHLWKATIPGRFGRAPEFVAVDDAIYIPLGRTCLVLDPVTGKKRHELTIPAKLAKEAGAGWKQLRVDGDYFVATLGRHVVCLNRKTGKLLWSYRAQHDRLSVSLGDGRAFCAEIRKLSRKPRPNELKAKPLTQAFDLKTGKVLWKIPVASELRYSNRFKLVITNSGIHDASKGTLVRKNGLPFTVAGDRLISTTASQLTMQSLLTGSRIIEDLKWYRRGCTDLRSAPNLATTRYLGNAAYVDLATRKITPLWNVRSGCNNNLIPANGVLNVPNLTGGCECNYTPTSLGFVPLSVINGDKPNPR